MTIEERKAINREHILLHEYKMVHHSEFDPDILKYITYRRKSGRGDNSSYNEIIIMADTETSKSAAGVIGENHVCAWTISARCQHINLFTVYGHKPSTLVDTMKLIHDSMQGEKTIFFWHNASYDWQFIRRFCFVAWDVPERQLNTKSHYPIDIEFDNGIIFRDSLIIAQRSLDKWGSDMDVYHKKAVGSWDYDIIRNQEHCFTDSELEYIEHDTLCGIECIDALIVQLNKNITTLPYTATGVPREQVHKIARQRENRGHDRFKRQAPEWEQQAILQRWVYHGGYTHGNRDLVGWVIDDHITDCYDFCSSYPYCLLSYKFPMERFTPTHKDLPIDRILRNADEYAFYFKLCILHPKVNDDCMFPALQFSKCVRCINGIFDNGRILEADYIEIYLTEQDATIIRNQYSWERHNCTDVNYAHKRFLPRWFTDYVYKCFQDKTMLKGGDPVQYSISKSILNSLYGMCVQRPVRDQIREDYQTGEYITDQVDYEEEYNKFIERRTSVLPYQWGVWVTAYAMRNLFDLGSCAGTWIYSDTDSCYGYDWDMEKLNAYNDNCKRLLQENGYGAVMHNGREYWLGVAEHDGSYTEFKFLGAKRYCCRDAETGKLKITVAGVPKNGAKCLNDDINNFKKGFIFPGSVTGKKTHTYFWNDIHIDDAGNEVADSIDLSPCDYALDMIESASWDDIFKYEEVRIQAYE